MLSDIPWPRPHRINQFTIPSPLDHTARRGMGELGGDNRKRTKRWCRGNTATSAGLLQDKTGHHKQGGHCLCTDKHNAIVEQTSPLLRVYVEGGV